MISTHTKSESCEMFKITARLSIYLSLNHHKVLFGQHAEDIVLDFLFIFYTLFYSCVACQPTYTTQEHTTKNNHDKKTSASVDITSLLNVVRTANPLNNAS